MDTLTDFEKKNLKEAVCRMIDDGCTLGHTETMELREHPRYGGLSYYDFNHKVWEISIKVVRTNEYDEL